MRTGAGVPTCRWRSTGCARWRATSDVARRFQDGRVFLAGDAAHLMPPNGGFGGNTGIHDAHNLAWKLALVLKGVAGPALLDTYEAERKPVGKFTVEQAYTRYVTRTATYLGAKDYQPPAHDFNIELGYLYRFARGRGRGRRRRQGPRGSAPHVRPARLARAACLARARRQRISTDRSVRASFVLLAAREGAAWCAARRCGGQPLQEARAGGVLRRRTDSARPGRAVSRRPTALAGGRGAGAAGRFRRLARRRRGADDPAAVTLARSAPC